MSVNLAENATSWGGLQRSILPLLSSTELPQTSIDLLESWKRARHFYGVLAIPGALQIPAQLFFVNSHGTKTTIESKPTDSWPQILIEVQDKRDPMMPEVRVALRASDSSVYADILYTRAMYALSETGSYLLVSQGSNGPRAIQFKCQPLTGEIREELFRRAKLSRKLAFIERTFNQHFMLPDEISPTQLGRIEVLFEGLVNGEFVSRTPDITIPVRASDVNLSEPPFNKPGPFKQYLGEEEFVLEHDRALPIGPIYIEFKRAMVADERVLKSLRNDTAEWVRFQALDSQVRFIFEKYKEPYRHSLVLRRLKKLYSEFLRVEAEPLAHTLFELLIRDVTVEQAVEIATGWLIYNGLPDRFSVQEPRLEEKTALWRAPIYLVFANGKNSHVVDLLIDCKSGSIVDEPNADEVRERASTLAEQLLSAR